MLKYDWTQLLMKDLLNWIRHTGVDYSDIFIEETNVRAIRLEDNKVEKVISGKNRGAGIRLICGQETVYGHLNELNIDTIKQLAGQLADSLAVRKKIEPGPSRHPAAPPSIE